MNMDRAKNNSPDKANQTVHDHSLCIREALARAEKICFDRKVQLTVLRRAVLELIWQAHQPIKAYALLAQFNLSIAAHEPPNIYRSLDFLYKQGLIHKIHSLSAYIGCAHPEAHAPCVLFYCKKCKIVTEYCDAELLAAIELVHNRHLFQVDAGTCEFLGICASCQTT